MTACLCTARAASLLIVSVFGHAAPAAELPAVQPARVREVRYLGADHLSKTELKELTGVSPGDPMNPARNEQGRLAILRKYQEEGRFFASAELAEGGSRSDTRVVYEVVEGPVVRVSEIRFRGNGAVDAEKLLAAKRNSGATVGVKLRPAATEADVKALVECYRGLGFAEPKVTPEIVRSAEMCKIIVVYHILEAKK